MTVIQKIAALRASLGLPRDAASDRIWAERISANKNYTYQDASNALKAKQTEMHQYRETVADLRRTMGLVNDPASDAIWANRMIMGKASFATVTDALVTKQGNTYGGHIPGHGDTNPWLAGPSNPPSPIGGSDDDQEALRELGGRITNLFPWMSEELITMFIDEYIQSGGDSEFAMARIRSSQQYKTIFAGNVREDGTLRMNEIDYVAGRDAFALELYSYGLDPSMLAHMYPQLVEGGVSPDGFRRKMAVAYSEIAVNLTQVREYYATRFGNGDLSMAALIANALDPSTNPIVFEEQIRQSQIAGEGMVAGFNLDLREVEKLSSFGLTQEASRGFFTQARHLLPTLNTMMARHNDPADEFDISNLGDALIMGDPDQRQTMQRLFSAEQSQFTPWSLFQIQQGGAVSGLRQG